MHRRSSNTYLYLTEVKLQSFTYADAQSHRQNAHIYKHRDTKEGLAKGSKTSKWGSVGGSENVGRKYGKYTPKRVKMNELGRVLVGLK